MAEASTRWRMSCCNGFSAAAHPAIQSHIVERCRSAPCRFRIFSRRCSGWWSPYLFTITCASSPGPARHFSIG
jgi:hypothetical protein